jgi:probable HAF family extracellular repeat protein
VLVALVAGALLLFVPVVNAGQGNTAAATPSLPTYKVIAVCEMPVGTGRESPDSYNLGAEDINDRGQIVGRAGWEAFFWEKGVITYLTGLPRTVLDGQASVAHAINERGQVVGGSGSWTPFMGGGYDCLPFLWENGKARNLGGNENGAFSHEAFDINDAGMVVGFFRFRGFTLFEGRWKELGTLSKRPVGNGSRVLAVNNRGQFVGATTVEEKGAEYLPVHAFLWVKVDKNGRGGRMKDLGTLPGWRHSTATDLNERGDVVGYTGKEGYARGATVQQPGRAVLWRSGGKISALPSLPGAQESRAEAINNAGQIVGTSGGRAVLWQNGRVLDLNAHIPKDSGWVLKAATAVNNRGWIAGRGTKDGTPSSFFSHHRPPVPQRKAANHDTPRGNSSSRRGPTVLRCGDLVFVRSPVHCRHAAAHLAGHARILDRQDRPLPGLPLRFEVNLRGVARGSWDEQTASAVIG